MSPERIPDDDDARESEDGRIVEYPFKVGDKPGVIDIVAPQVRAAQR